MNEVNIKGIIQADIRSIKNELIENTAGFIQNLVKSLRVIKVKPFSAYKVDLSLSYLKKVYENAFPVAKHGGPRIAQAKESRNLFRDALPDQVTPSVTWATSISVVDKAIVINLFKGIKLIGKVPSFVELIRLRSELSRSTIQNKIRVGNYIANCTEDNVSILLFRSNKISHTKFLQEINKKEKKGKNENDTEKDKVD